MSTDINVNVFRFSGFLFQGQLTDCLIRRGCRLKASGESMVMIVVWDGFKTVAIDLVLSDTVNRIANALTLTVDFW